MELLNSPIPHLVGNLDQELYEYCVNNWQENYDEVNEEGRYNILIKDHNIIRSLTKITKTAMHKLLPFIIEEYPNWKPSNTTLKFQYSGNIVSETSYNMRDWHLDNGDKIIVGLWYFKHPEDTNDGGLHISNGKDEIYYPYESNKIVFIPNLTNAWHKVGNRTVWNYDRRFINIVVKQDEFVHDYLRNDYNTDGFREVNNLMR